MADAEVIGACSRGVDLVFVSFVEIVGCAGGGAGVGEGNGGRVLGCGGERT